MDESPEIGNGERNYGSWLELEPHLEGSGYRLVLGEHDAPKVPMIYSVNAKPNFMAEIARRWNLVERLERSIGDDRLAELNVAVAAHLHAQSDPVGTIAEVDPARTPQVSS